MNIEHYDYIYPVVHDLSTVRSSTFSKIDYEKISLLNTTRGKLVPKDLFGVFIDERNNIFLGLESQSDEFSSQVAKVCSICSGKLKVSI